MVEAKVKTDEEYGKQFCALMNADIEMTDFINYKIAKELKKFVVDVNKHCKTLEGKAYDEILYSTQGELMSLMAFVYGKGRVKEDEMNN